MFLILGLKFWMKIKQDSLVCIIFEESFFYIYFLLYLVIIFLFFIFVFIFDSFIYFLSLSGEIELRPLATELLPNPEGAIFQETTVGELLDSVGSEEV